MGEVVGTDLICSVHYHEKNTPSVCASCLEAFSPTQNPRWTETLSLDPKRTSARQTLGQKRQTVREEQKEQRGDKSRHLEEEANTRLFVQWG